MAEFSARDNYVGEDWESECSESAACSGAVYGTVPSGSSTGRTAFDVCRPVERDDVSKYSELSAGVESRESELCEVTDHHSDDHRCHSDRSTYVKDSKKVFVSNVNYRVSVQCFMPRNVTDNVNSNAKCVLL